MGKIIHVFYIFFMVFEGKICTLKIYAYLTYNYNVMGSLIFSLVLIFWEISG